MRRLKNINAEKERDIRRVRKGGEARHPKKFIYFFGSVRASLTSACSAYSSILPLRLKNQEEL